MTITELRELLAKATPGPWTDEHPHDNLFRDKVRNENGLLVAGTWPSSMTGAEKDNSALIAAAVNALPALLDAAEALDEWTNTSDDYDHIEFHQQRRLPLGHERDYRKRARAALEKLEAMQALDRVTREPMPNIYVRCDCAVIARPHSLIDHWVPEPTEPLATPLATGNEDPPA